MSDRGLVPFDSSHGVLLGGSALVVGTWKIAVAGSVIGVAGVTMRVTISALRHGEETERDFLPFYFEGSVSIVRGLGAWLVLVGWASVVGVIVLTVILVTTVAVAIVVAVVATTIVAVVAIAVVPGGCVVGIVLVLVAVLSMVGVGVRLVVLVGHGIHLLIEHMVGHVGGHLVGVVGCVGWQAVWLWHVVKRGWLAHVVGLLLWSCIVHVLCDVM